MEMRGLSGKKVAICFNLCNSGWMIQRAFNSVGIDADLFVSASELDTPSDPRWNDPEIFSVPEKRCFFWNADRETAQLYKKNTLFPVGANSFLNLLRFSKCLNKNYDFIVGVTLGAIPAYLSRKPFCWIATGSDLRRWIGLHRPSSCLLRKAAQKACAIFTGRDEGLVSSAKKYELEEKMHYLVGFIPQLTVKEGVIALRQLLPESNDDPLRVFMPTLQQWTSVREGHPGRGNDLFLRAVAKIHQSGCKIDVLLLERGEDVHATKKLVSELGLEDVVSWKREMTKEELHEHMLTSHVVANEFTFGAPGTICLEAMALGRPVLAYMNEWQIKQGMPILNCRTEPEIYEALLKCYDRSFLADLGRRSLVWTQEKLSYHYLGNLLRMVMRSVL